MARSAKKAESLAEESQSMADAMGHVLDVADEKGVVTWSDVSDDISSGEWGRLIEQSILVDVDGDGFVVDDPEGIHGALEDAEPDDDEGGGWSTWDKLAGVGAVALIAGYSIPSIKNTVGAVLDTVLGPIEATMPFYMVILVLATLTGLWSALLQDNLMDMSGMGDHQEKMQELQDRRERAKEEGNEEELDRIQQEQMEMMSDQMGMFKQQIRPMVWIMLLTIPIFLWLYWRTGNLDLSGVAIVMPLFGEISNWNAGTLGPWPAWLFWYFICSLSFSQIVRKALNVQTSPT